MSEEATFKVNKLYQLGCSAFGVIHPLNRYSLKVSSLPGLGNKDEHMNHQDRIAWVYSLDVCVRILLLHLYCVNLDEPIASLISGLSFVKWR